MLGKYSTIKLYLQPQWQQVIPVNTNPYDWLTSFRHGLLSLRWSETP